MFLLLIRVTYSLLIPVSKNTDSMKVDIITSLSMEIDLLAPDILTITLKT